MNIATFKKILFVGISLIPSVSSAQGGGGSAGGGVSFPNPVNKQSLIEIVNAILEFITEVGAVVTVLFMVYSGFLFIIARGDPGKLNQAKSSLLWVIVGGMVVLGAFALSEIVKNTARQFGVSV